MLTEESQTGHDAECPLDVQNPGFTRTALEEFAPAGKILLTGVHSSSPRP